MFRRFGSQATVVQRADRLLTAEDPEISAAVADGFRADGIEVLLGDACVAVTGHAGRSAPPAPTAAKSQGAICCNSPPDVP